MSAKKNNIKTFFKTLPKNIFSGFVVSLIALPLGLGLAMASEAPPISGVITAIVGGVIVSILGGSYVTISGPGNGLVGVVLIAITTLGLTATYAAIGAGWLLYKTENDLQKRAVNWMKKALIFTLIGMAIISIITPLASDRIFAKWFAIPEIIALAPLPLMSGLFFVFTY